MWQEPIDFDEQDLYANRSGYMSERQQAYLLKMSNRSRAYSLVVIAGVQAFMVGIFGYIMFTMPADQRERNLPMIGIVFTLTMVFIAVSAFLTLGRTSRRIRRGRVQTITAPIQAMGVPYRQGMYYLFQIKNKPYVFMTRQHRVVNGGVYNLYFTKLSGMNYVLSMEPA